ncbi:TolC family protein [Prolixibacteraceae bacterium Z1-6]|uniref:TolC family protein n=1 Tax=Draconibacterium aestuarii TaxID=2998507 RepID=A0A9X3J6I2_9BACT|nr:TolC family protein [Prolixibacteraceae bacterium Z1-6]
MKKYIILLFFPIQMALGQNTVPLDSCYVWARENYPNLKQSVLWQQITALKKGNIETTYFPKVTLNGQFTYQSEVTELPIEMSGVTVPSVSKDRYNAYAELQQTIWDGGISVANKTLEDAILKSNLSQLEVELYKLNEQVAQAFFTTLVADQQKEVLTAQITAINESLKTIESGIRNGAIEKSSALVLEAEKLNLEQNIVEIGAAKNASAQMLTILTGETIDKNASFIYSTANANLSSDFLRPELQLFENQRLQLGTQQGLLSKTRNPKLYGFGKVGYGKPGLNMLLDEFKGYYLVGVGLSWNAFDWENNSRQKQILQIQQEMLKNQEATFMQNIQLLLVQQKEQIAKLETMLENDNKMVALRTYITKSAASKLENQTITASDYVRELQAETISKLNTELHKIQLNQAQEKYNLIKGK